MPDTAGPEQAVRLAQALDLCGVRVRRDGRGDGGPPVLDIAAATVAPGETVALVGPSGAGKTTLLDVIAGLTVPDAGGVSWGGTPVSGLAETRRDLWRRAHVGFVFQSVQLVPELSARDNVLLPFLFGGWRVAAADERRGRALLAELGLGDGSQRAGRLSRGEAQRVAVARALAGAPPLVLADEPTASLDRDNAERVADLLLADARRRGATLIVATHDSTLVRRLGRTVALVAGRIAGPS